MFTIFTLKIKLLYFLFLLFSESNILDYHFPRKLKKKSYNNREKIILSLHYDTTAADNARVTEIR